jgi:hypothetical protein
MYGAITLYGPTFQTVPLTLPYNLFSLRSEKSEARITGLRLPASELVVLQPQALLSNRLV